MAGILDNKARIMDVVVTEEGRRQMSTGKMKIEFVTFTDRHTYYEGDAASGSVNPSDRLFLEATALPQDKITPEFDSSGNILFFAGGDLEVGAAGSVYKPSSTARLTEVTSSAVFASLTASLLEQSLESFKKQFIIGSYPDMDVDPAFDVNVDYASFTVNDTSPLSSPMIPDVDNLPPNPFHESMLFTRHTDFMPPIFTDTAGVKKLFVRPGYSWPDLTAGRSLDDFEDAVLQLFKGNPAVMARNNPSTWESYPSRAVSLLEGGSPDMNIACQIYETARNDTKITKLDMVDTGYWSTPTGVTYRIIYVGRTIIDSNNIPCFVRMFTLVFNNSSDFSSIPSSVYLSAGSSVGDASVDSFSPPTEGTGGDFTTEGDAFGSGGGGGGGFVIGGGITATPADGIGSGGGSSTDTVGGSYGGFDVSEDIYSFSTSTETNMYKLTRYLLLEDQGSQFAIGLPTDQNVDRSGLRDD